MEISSLIEKEYVPFPKKNKNQKNVRLYLEKEKKKVKYPIGL